VTLKRAARDRELRSLAQRLGTEEAGRQLGLSRSQAFAIVRAGRSPERTPVSWLAPAAGGGAKVSTTAVKTSEVGSNETERRALARTLDAIDPEALALVIGATPRPELTVRRLLEAVAWWGEAAMADLDEARTAETRAAGSASKGAP
jgi:hypothetical protein